MSPPRLSYIVCATPRSGSTLLCEALKSTGVAGRPEEYFEALRHSGMPRRPAEYFHGMRDRSALDHLGEHAALAEPTPRSPIWDSEDYGPYLRWALEEGTGENGVFGAKLMAGYLGDFVTLLRTISAYRGLDLANLFAAVFGEVRFVRIVRANKLRQAISLWKALQTATWRQERAGEARQETNGGEPPVQPQLRFHLGAIEHLISQLAADDARWDAFFEVCRIKPLTIVYERFVDRYEITTKLLLNDLGIGVPPGLRFERSMQRQTDDLNREWARRYGELTIGADPDLAPATAARV
jgi:LPS sulfotransferase NodH